VSQWGEIIFSIDFDQASGKILDLGYGEEQEIVFE
jgi:hypothetical protein